ncbi:alpha/beta-hydrolase [Hypoxylon sp. NC1633]|nr:alpha/beta-hydrolase [Hypoxylon sp. NC1633]
MTNTIRISLWICLAACAGVFSAALGHYGGKQLDALPSVDLGYEVHQGYVNSTGRYYTFSNVPYAQQPVGDLRFQKPVAINSTSSEINDGSGGSDVMCPQAYPQWVINLMAERSGIDSDTMASFLKNQPGQTEACLLLDVHVPAEIFNQGPAAEASVLVWIHGGGFTFGSKTQYGSPAGLIARSRRNHDDGIIVVSINYRLGMYGWLAGDDVTPNIGLHDQRLALNWVQEYIALFGGSAKHVTVMGESAGASSIVHHITAYGGEEPAPFRAAISQSPAFQFNIDLATGYANTLTEASAQAGTQIEGVDDLRALSPEMLRTINQGTVAAAPVGTFGFGPGPDGSYVTDTPQVLLYGGKFDSSVDLLISHTSNESIPFLPREILTSADVRAYLIASNPQAAPSTIDALLTDPALYPDDLSGAYGWQTEYARAARLASDLGFACTARLLALARGNATYSYVFAYPPAWHAGDVPYVFFNGDTSSPNNGLPVDGALARSLQDYIVAFARGGDPNAGPRGEAGSEDRIEFPVYGSEARVLELGYTGWRETTDDLVGGRCEWIQQAMVDGRL